jgi:hypothetical protein
MIAPAAIQATATGSWFEARLTLDGLMTVVGGVIAFIAVLLQNRDTRLQVDRQLRAEKEARTQQEDERRRAVAGGLFVEIDGFYLHHLVDARKVLSKSDLQRNVRPLLTSEALEENSLPVYLGNSSGIGTLDQDCAARVVRFYSVANTFLAMIRASENRRENNDFFHADIYADHGRKYVAEAIRLGYEACQSLCELCGVPFVPLHVKIAAEKPHAEIEGHAESLIL